MTPEQEKTHEDHLRCELCGTSSQIINILPIKQTDGKLNTLACDECAKKSGAYCLTHQRPHLGFGDGTTACKECIDEKVETDTQEIVSDFFRNINASPHKEPIVAALVNWSKFLSDTLRLPYETNVARAIVTASFRFHKTPEEIIKQVCHEGSEVILPQFDSLVLKRTFFTSKF